MNHDYLLTRKPLWALTVFAIPIIIGNFFQQIYNMADSAIVGRFVGEQALAAVGASYALTNVFICIAMGGGVGASVIVSRQFGAHDYRKMKVSVYTAFLTFLVFSICLAAVGWFRSSVIMTWLHTPQEILEMAVNYLRIYFLGLPFLFMYNVISAMFNALGQSKYPLGFLIFSSLFNIVLDVFLVTKLNMGVAGVAWATLIAQGISALLSFLVFLRLLDRLNSEKVSLFDKRSLAEMTRVALPSILQQSTVSIGMMLVQSVVNGFGTEALAGYSAASKVETLCFVPLMGISNALCSYTAQNLGAGNRERVVKGYRTANGMEIVSGALICFFLEVFHSQIIMLFLGKEGTAVARSTGEAYLTFLGWFFCILGFKLTTDAVLRGAKDMKMFTVANMANFSFRVIFAMVMAPGFGIHMVWIASPIGWLINWMLSYLEYRRGKWKMIA